MTADLSQEEREELRRLCTPGWAGAMVAGLALRIDRAKGDIDAGEDGVEEARHDFRVAQKLATALPHLLASARVEGELANALTMTGCKSEEDLIDMANVGQSLMERIGSVVETPGPFHGWAPADDPAEIVFDLLNALEEALSSEPIQAGWREKVAELVRAAKRYVECSTRPGVLSPYVKENGRIGTKSPWAELCEAIAPAEDALSQLPSGGEAPDGWRSQSEWKALLDGRDEFIVNQGLWLTFVDQLPPTGRVDADGPHQAREEADQ